MKIFNIILLSLIIFACSDEMKLTEEEQEKYSEQGIEIVRTSFNTLKTHLVTAIEREGIGNAIKYCNLKALHLMDSLSKEYNAEIRRTSSKARNPKDKPLDYEESTLEEFHEKFKNGEALIPVLKKFKDESIVFFVPILIDNPICLNCHGPKNIMVTEPNERIIQSLYPTDEATGYKMGDLRGMWSVRFKKQ